ncbi:hypothetical protein E2E30_02570 [Sphingomonas sp. AAP5]|nr:hypothetical protein E2E30_02570 [Sphingomonas sp. AAP5]
MGSGADVALILDDTTLPRHPGLVPGSTVPHGLRGQFAHPGGPRDKPGVTDWGWGGLRVAVR